MKVRPTKDRICVIRDKTQDRIGNIFIPDDSKVKCTQGKVIGIGPDVHGVRIGDIIKFGKSGGVDAEINNLEVTFVQQENVVGIVD